MRNNRVNTVFLAILTLIAVGAVIKIAKPVILPLVIAWLVSYLFTPLVDLLKKIKVPLGPAIVVILLLVLVLCLLIGLFVQSGINAFSSSYKVYEARLDNLLLDKLRNLFAADAEYESLVTKFAKQLNWGEMVGSIVQTVSGSMVSLVSNLVMVLVFLVFFLLGRPFINVKLEKAFSPENAQRIMSVQNSITSQIGHYLSLQFVLSLVTGICVYLALLLIKVEFAVTWGVLAFLLNFIPAIGSIVATVPPILIALVQYTTPLQAIITFFVLLTIQMGIGNFLGPKLYGDSLHLSPLVVLISLLFWGWLWGPIGALLSIP
ncbi:MAG: AI-2E family transporter, partial [Clostridiaceae bacterium]|nr:AI-2E family transporter [Clostridiaceae bacterium]